MRERRRESSSRVEINESIDDHGEIVEAKQEELEVDERDNEIVSETIEALGDAGTEEGSEEVDRHMVGAAEHTERQFEADGEELEQEHAEIEESEEELGERSELVEKDEERIQEAVEQTEHGETSGALENAAESAREDVEFFDEAREELEEIERDSEERLEVLRNLVKSRGRG